MADDSAPTGLHPRHRPGWYADPIGRFELRFHNGEQWTADVSTDGSRFVDPMGSGPSSGGHSGEGATGAATASMVLGVVAVSTAWMPFLVVVGIVTALLAVGFGVSALRGRHHGAGRGRAVAGVTMGGCALVAAILGVMLTVLVLDVYGDYVDPAEHDVTIDSCDLAGSRATARGTLHNLDDSPEDFSIVIGFVRPGTNDVRATARVELEQVAGGGSSSFEAQRQVPLDTVDCVIVDVTGPLPFGIALD